MSKYVKPVASMVQLVANRAFATGCTVVGSCTNGDGLSSACLAEMPNNFVNMAPPEGGV